MQDVVVEQSSAVGWTPEHYAATKTMFVVRHMQVQHFRELKINDEVLGRTWPVDSRRGMLFHREVRLLCNNAAVAVASQQWAYLNQQLVPTKAGADLLTAFSLHPGFGAVELVPLSPCPKARIHTQQFSIWHQWMDPFGHLNHPDYVGLCDEAISCLMAAHQLDPQQLVAVAESVQFKMAINAGDVVRVDTELAGTQNAVAMFRHRLFVEDKLAAQAVTYRTLRDTREESWMQRLR